MLFGKPYGGTAILWRKSALNNVKVYKMENNSRCIGLSFNVDNGMYLSDYNDELEIEILECLNFIEDLVLDAGNDTAKKS